MSVTTMVLGGASSMTARWRCICPIGPPAPTNHTLPPGLMSCRVLAVYASAACSVSDVPTNKCCS